MTGDIADVVYRQHARRGEWTYTPIHPEHEHVVAQVIANIYAAGYEIVKREPTDDASASHSDLMNHLRAEQTHAVHQASLDALGAATDDASASVDRAVLAGEPDAVHQLEGGDDDLLAAPEAGMSG